MKIHSVNHIGINTIDLKASEQFYQDMMGLEFLGEVDLGGDYVAYFKVDDVTQIELFLTEGFPEKTPGDGYIGQRHLAFDVDDVEEWAADLKEKSVRITYGPADLPAIKKRVMLFEAPDHVIIELMMDMK